MLCDFSILETSKMFGSSSTLATDDPDTAALFGPDAAQGKLSFVVFVILEWLVTVLFTPLFAFKN
jgi:hypothetical protein